MKSKFADLTVEIAKAHQRREKPQSDDDLGFGKYFSDHMLTVEWCRSTGWGKPKIEPFRNLSLHPGAKVLHYAIEVFEGMKAFWGKDNKIRIFRPDFNVQRFRRSANHVALPDFDGNEFLECIKKLLDVDSDWFPRNRGSSMYIRPTFIATEGALGVTASQNALIYVVLLPSGGYFGAHQNAIGVMADRSAVRAWPGGCGHIKMGSNYAPTIQMLKKAETLGLQQVLWLFGDDSVITELGTSNVFTVVRGSDGHRQLITHPLDGLILPGVIRDSILHIARDLQGVTVEERPLSIKEIIRLNREGHVLEMFSCGTASVVCPIKTIWFEDSFIQIPSLQQPRPMFKTLLDHLEDIFYGCDQCSWVVTV